MKSTLQIVRATASFSAWWHVVPFALSAVAIVVACLVQVLAGGDTGNDAVVEVPVTVPIPVDAHGT